MSYYVHGSNLSYQDYLQAKNFVSDLGAASREAGRGVALAVSRQTREVIASNETLARENIRVMEASAAEISGAMNQGFEQLSYDMGEIADGISELNATFHWGFGEVIATLGHMNDTLETLVEIAKTPVQTAAFNHFAIARDAFRQGLYPECLEELDKAVSGDHTSSGYKMEWRFHKMMGTLRLGFAGCALELVDLAAAEESFLLAARYARADYPEDAARAALSAGWAAYCQGKLPAALEHTEQALTLDNKLGEAYFQKAKVKMAGGEVEAALPVLGQAIGIDRFYALKAAGDGDFQAHDERLREFIEALRQEKYCQLRPEVEAELEKFVFFRQHFSEARQDGELLASLEDFLIRGGDWPLVDLLELEYGWETYVTGIEEAARQCFITIPTRMTDGFREVVETFREEETFEEEVVVKPGGLFRRAVKEMVTKTRMVEKNRLVKVPVEEEVDEIYNAWGEKIATSFLFTGFGGKSFALQFCSVPAGTFTMGEGNEPRRVTLSRGFLMGRFPVTQTQWQAVMGSNPSHLKGADRPVESVFWDDCQEFINKLNLISGKSFRLPTEAEWEYACRAGAETTWYFGNDESKLGEYAWYKDNSGGQTHPVGEKKPNAWGLSDMHGNVWEWCQDYYSDILPGGSFTDPQGPDTGALRVLRGGSWSSWPASVRAADRDWYSAANRLDLLGFRLAFSSG